jgi:hypothetical protein
MSHRKKAVVIGFVLLLVMCSTSVNVFAQWWGRAAREIGKGVAVSVISDMIMSRMASGQTPEPPAQPPSQFLGQLQPAPQPVGLPSRSQMTPCGCYGPNIGVFPEPRCGQGIVVPAGCEVACPLGGEAYAYVCY